MVETRRSSSSKRALSSSPPPNNPKRSKASESSSSTNEVQSVEPVELLGPVKESVSEPGGVELRSPDPENADPLKAAANDVAEFDAAVLPEKSVEVVAEGDAAVDAEKSNAVASASGRGKKRPSKLPKSNPKAAWGKLLSQSSQTPHLFIRETLFTVGQSVQCNLSIKDPSISNTLCRLRHIKRGNASVALLEITGGKGAVLVNGKPYQRTSSVILTGGDEVVFSSLGKHAYVSFF